MDKLPDEILRNIFLNLRFADLTRIESVCSQWNRVAKTSWTTKSVGDVELSELYDRPDNQFEAMLQKCGPYMEAFGFLPKGVKMVEISRMQQLVQRFRLLNVTRLYVRNISFVEKHVSPMVYRNMLQPSAGAEAWWADEDLSFNRDMMQALAGTATCSNEGVSYKEHNEFGQQFLAEFANLQELAILASDYEGFEAISSDFPQSLAFTDNMPNLTALYLSEIGSFKPNANGIGAALFESLAPKLKFLHLGCYMSGQAAPVLASYLSNLTRLQELSLSTSVAFDDAALLQVAQNCRNLEAVFLRYPLQLTDGVCRTAIGFLPKIRIFWNRGKFFFPKITTKEDLMRAEAAYDTTTWMQRFIKRSNSGYNCFYFDFDHARNSSYDEEPVEFSEDYEDCYESISYKDACISGGDSD